MRIHTLSLMLLLIMPIRPGMAHYQNEPAITNSIRLNLLDNQLEVDGRPILQSFFWMTPRYGDWYPMLESKLDEFANVGFGGIWSPPPQKTVEGNFPSGGYEPYDYFDLGEFDQQGNVETRYGSRAELESLISKANQLDVAMIADIVINHNVGGDPEFNEFTGTTTYTNFESIASGRFPRNYTHFHPCAYEEADDASYADFPDLCHAHPYVQQNLVEWGKWLRDEIGFDAWRFDVAHGVIPEMIKGWMDEIGGFGVTEHLLWPANSIDDTLDYMKETNYTHTSMDFFLTFALRNMIVRNGLHDMSNFLDNTILGRLGGKYASTFVVNHDTVRDDIGGTFIPYHREMGYAFILTHEGYPYVYWDDYFDEDLQRHLKALINIRANYARGGTEVLYNDEDVYIMQRTGDPGLIFAVNDNPNRTSPVNINTKFTDTVLQELTGQNLTLVTDSTGMCSIIVPPRGFAIYGVGDPVISGISIPDRENPDNWATPSTIPYTKDGINIDGKLDDFWANPLYLGREFEQIGNQKSLQSLYAMNDDQYLYLGINTGRTGYLDEEYYYGIALDTQKGGPNEGPGVKANLRFSLNNEPEYLIFLKTDNSTTWNEVQSGTLYSYAESWDDGVVLKTDQFKMDNILGFTELKIPLEDIDLKFGGEVGIKVFSTDFDNQNIERTIPFDDALLTSDGLSWLNIPERLELRTSNTSTSSASGPFLSMTILTYSTIRYMRKHRKSTRIFH